MAAPTIVEINPVSGEEGVVLADRVSVTFDQEIDHTSVSIVLEGPDTDRWSGPDQIRWDDPSTTVDDDVLASPGYAGVVAGTLTFEKVDESGDAVSGLDYTGGGTMWYTKAIFTPELPLAANTQYRVYVVGDEDDGDEIEGGVSSRTVFDGLKGANIGDGSAIFSGGYTGSINDTYNITIKGTGDAEDGVTFEWYRTSAPALVRELATKLSSQLLSNGVMVRFENDFVVGDTFSVVVKPAVRMESTYTWLFTTGAGSIETVPSTVSPSTPVGGFSDLPGAIVSATSDGLRVVSTTPVNRATNLDPDSIETIVIQFSADLDEDTITDDAVEIWAEPVNGDPSIDAEGALVKLLSVSGDTLTIQIG